MDDEVRSARTGGDFNPAEAAAPGILWFAFFPLAGRGAGKAGKMKRVEEVLREETMISVKSSIFWVIVGLAVVGVVGIVAALISEVERTQSVAVLHEAMPLTMDEQTRQNFLTAMHGEAFAYVKYMLYAEEARRSGNPELAALFEATAQTERFEHFAEEAKLAGLVGNNEANLRDAIQGESYEVDTMYRQFAEQAAAAGDRAAAERFSEIRKDEMGHRDAYQAALDKLRLGAVESKAEAR